MSDKKINKVIIKNAKDFLNKTGPFSLPKDSFFNRSKNAIQTLYILDYKKECEMVIKQDITKIMNDNWHYVEELIPLMGCYENRVPHDSYNSRRIYLCDELIKRVSKKLEIDYEKLFLIVLFHEIGHLLTDTSKHRDLNLSIETKERQANAITSFVFGGQFDCEIKELCKKQGYPYNDPLLFSDFDEQEFKDKFYKLIGGE